jgi:hypothetical protein
MYFFDILMNNLGFKKRDAIHSAQLRWKRRPTGQSAPTQRPPSPKGGMIEYVMNDWTTPHLVKKMSPPTPPETPVFSVKLYDGGGHDPHTPQGQAANCYVTIANSLNYMLSHSERKLSRWAGTNNLVVIPRAGKQLNAFYNRLTLQFFFEKNMLTNKMVFTADSSDIVAHELGHAILDSFRPDLWSIASLEVWSFHEAFSDLSAVLHIMLYDEVLIDALEKTRNDIRKHNVFSDLAEDVGSAIYAIAKSGRNPNYLRSGINNFKYVNPGTLPKHAPNDKLAAECHSFGRIFFGAFYDILVMFYESNLKEGMSALDALKKARDTLTAYTMKSIQNCPRNPNFYNAMAKTMLWADWSAEKKYHDRMRDIFLSRNLITSELRILSAPPCNNNENIVRKGQVKMLKLSDYVIRSQSDNNPLYDVVLEVPQEEAYLYDNNKNIIDVVSATEEETLRSAIDMITYLHETNSVDNTENTPFEIRDGKLVRTHFE